MLSRPNTYLRSFKSLKHQYSLRVIDLEGSPYFVLSDVLSNLSMGSTTKALSILDESAVFDVLVAGRGRPNKVVDIGCVLQLIQSARSTPARHFTRWMENHVLPSVFSDGLNVTDWTTSTETDESVDNTTSYESVDGFLHQQRILLNHHHKRDVVRIANEMCALSENEIRVGQWFAPHLKSMVDVEEYPTAVLELAYNFLTKTGAIPAYEYSEAIY